MLKEVQESRGRHHPVHRRAAHHGGRGRGRRVDGRLEHAEADAGPRRAALRGRHHAQRVPEAHREGRRPGAALPARLRGRARRGGDDRHPARPEGALRGPPRRAHPGRGPGGRGHALATATSPTASCPTRPSTSWTRRQRACASRSTACPWRSTSWSGASSSSRSSARPWPRRRTRPRKERREKIEKELADLKERSSAMKAEWQREKQALEKVKQIKARDREGPLRDRAGDARRATSARRPSCATARCPSWSGSSRRRRRASRRRRGRACSRRRWTRRTWRRSSSKWTGIPVTRMLEGEIEKLLHIEDRLRRAGGGPGRRAAHGGQRGAPLTRRPGRSQAAHRLLPLHGADRRGQDRAGARAGRVPVRRREGHGPHRHVGVHGEARGVAADRRAARATSATTRAASSPRPCAGARTRSCSSTRSRRPTPTCSTSCCRSSTTGRLTDGKGRTVDFRNTVLIMTSNVASDVIQEMARARRPED